MKKIIATIAIVLAAGFMGVQVASAYGHGQQGGHGPMHRVYCNTVTSRTGHGWMRYGRMGHVRMRTNHGFWSCWTNRGPGR